MKWPSLESLWNDTLGVITRFPIQVLITLLAIAACFVLVDYRGSPVIESDLIKFLLLCNLALVLLISADLFAEVHELHSIKKGLLRGTCLLICTVLYFTLQPNVYTADVYRFGLLALAFHLLVAFAPFINKGTLDGFWAYNKILFLRFLNAVLYSLVLFAGLAIALRAVSELFNVKIDWPVYLRLLALVGIGFNTLFFLAGVPADIKAVHDQQQPYPKGLKIFTQYVLIPLLTIYLTILLVYEAKILLNWELPKGLVSMLILGYAVFGVLSLLLVYPIKDKEGNGWISLFSRFFYIMMIPLVVLLLLAVWKRVGHYGLTEPRYILVVLALWLTLITAYFLISKKDNIKLIPVSLCILALLATYGPQSAFSVSRYSQTQRLKRLIEENDQKALKEKSSIIRYLVTWHGLISLQQFTTVNLQAVAKHVKDKAALDTAFALLKVKNVRENNNLVFFNTDQQETVPVKGFDYLVAVDNYASSQTSTINGVAMLVTKMGNSKLVVKIGADPEIVLNAKNMADETSKAYHQGTLKQKPSSQNFYVPHEKLIVRANNVHYDLSLMVTELTITYHGDQSANDFNFKGYLLIKIR